MYSLDVISVLSSLYNVTKSWAQLQNGQKLQSKNILKLSCENTFHFIKDQIVYNIGIFIICFSRATSPPGVSKVQWIRGRNMYQLGS